MPSYDYKCDNCGKTKTFILEMKHDDPLCDEKECPKDKTMYRLYTGINFVLKGGGWTETSSKSLEKKKKLKKLWDDSQVGDQPNPYFDELGREKNPDKKY
jgi:putative FmdB family regulatory protein